MRGDNVIVVAMCSIAVLYCLWLAIRSWNLVVFHPRPRLDRKQLFFDALRTLAGALAAAFIAGALAVGLGGRLVMRILGATSSDAQGLLTDADETVGEITFGGTVGFVVFVGFAGGLAAALVFLLFRSWLPARAGYAGLVLGVLLLGTFGTMDALSPHNNDFEILEPTWLAVTLIPATALLFGVTFTAVAVRLENGFRRIAYASYVALILLPVAIVGIVYVAARTFLSGVVPDGAQRGVLVAGRVLVGFATALALANTVRVILDIMGD